MKYILFFVIVFYLVSCKNKTELQFNNQSESKVSTNHLNCELSKELSEILNDYQIGSSPIQYPLQQSILLEIKEKTTFPILTRSEIICYDGNSKSLLPSEKSLIDCIEIVKRYHLEEKQELKQLMASAKLEYESFHPNGKTSNRFRTLTSDKGERFEEFLDIDSNGDTTKYQITGSGFGWHDCDKSLIDKPSHMGMYFNKGIGISYEKAGVAIEYDSEDKNSFHFGIGKWGSKSIYSFLNGHIKLSTVDIYPDNSPLDIYIFEYSENRLYFEDGAIITTKYENNKPSQRASFNYRTNKWLQINLNTDSTLIEMDYDLVIKKDNSDTPGLFVKKQNIDRRYYRNGTLMSEWDLSAKIMTRFSETGNIDSKVSQGFTEINEKFSNAWDNPVIQF